MNRRAAGVPPVVVPESERGHRAAQDDDSEPLGYFIGGCGHPAPIGPDRRIGECRVCEARRAPVPDVRLPASELYSLNAMASADTVSWWCRLCDHEATVAGVPAADTAAMEHLAACHHTVAAT